jgi:hypothetical protein
VRNPIAMRSDHRTIYSQVADTLRPFSYDGASRIATACGSTLDREEDVEKAVHEACSLEHNDRFLTEQQMQERQKRGECRTSVRY